MAVLIPALGDGFYEILSKGPGGYIVRPVGGGPTTSGVDPSWINGTSTTYFGDRAHELPAFTKREEDRIWPIPAAVIPATLPIPVPVPAGPLPVAVVKSLDSSPGYYATPAALLAHLAGTDAVTSLTAGPSFARMNIQGVGPMVMQGAKALTPLVMKLLHAALKNKTATITGLGIGGSLIGALIGVLGKSPKEFIEDQGFPEVAGTLGEDFLQFMENALQEGLLAIPETPRGYDTESFVEGLNYLHVNMKTGRMWLTDKVNVGRYKRWRD